MASGEEAPLTQDGVDVMERLLYTLAATPDSETWPLCEAILRECARRGISPSEAVKGFDVRVRFLVLNAEDCQGLSLTEPCYNNPAQSSAPQES